MRTATNFSIRLRELSSGWWDCVKKFLFLSFFSSSALLDCSTQVTSEIASVLLLVFPSFFHPTAQKWWGKLSCRRRLKNFHFVILDDSFCLRRHLSVQCTRTRIGAVGVWRAAGRLDWWDLIDISSFSWLLCWHSCHKSSEDHHLQRRNRPTTLRFNRLLNRFKRHREKHWEQEWDIFPGLWALALGKK